MKTLSLATIVVGILCLLAAVAGKFLGANVLKVEPQNYVHAASSLFLLALAVMYHARCYCSDAEKK